MAIASRQALIDYCLRQLGQDVIEINISEDQIEDRVDDALQFFQQYHFDGTEKVYLKHQVTGSQVVLSAGDASLFQVGETVTGNTSLCSFKVELIGGTNILYTKSFHGNSPTLGETLTGSNSLATATAGAVTLGDTENRWIPLTDSIIAVVNILPFTSGGSTNINMFDIRYQMMLNDMFALTNIQMTYYTQVQTHLSMINHFLNPQTSFQFNRHQNRLVLNVDWDEKVLIGDYLIVECFVILDPDTYTDVYNDRMLKKYLTALLKIQWGNNLKKFEGMQLPGGVTMNGQKIYEEGMMERDKIEQEIEDGHQLPTDFLVG